MNQSNAQKELREGVTYQPAVDLTCNQDNDIIEIPKQTSVPELQKTETNTDCCQVYCDIETTGLHLTSDITVNAVSLKSLGTVS